VVIEWAKTLCDVYIYLHEHKPNPIIYRDMKPSNLMKTPEGSVKLIDFGIAREYKVDAKSDTLLLGTKGYAAPEQEGLAQTDERSDIYSLGVTLYHLLTGISPREALGFKPLRQIDPQFSEGLEIIIGKCVMPDPKDRYQSARALLDDLNQIESFSQQYKQAQFKRTIRRLSFIASLCFFSYLTYAGFTQLQAEKVLAYDGHIEDAVTLLEEKQFEEAEVELDEAIGLIPERIDGYREKARLLYNQGQYAETENYIKDLFSSNLSEVQNDADLYYLLGSSFYEREMYEDAIGPFKKAGQISPNTTQYLRDLAVAYAKNDQFEEAEETLASIKKLKIDEEVTWYIEAEIASEQKELLKAEEGLKRVIDKGTNQQLLSKAYYALAQLYKKNQTELEDEDVTKRITVLEQGEKALVGTRNIPIIELLGEAYHEKAVLQDNDPTLLGKSIKAFQQILDLGYERPYLYRNIAILYQGMEKYDEAEEILLEMTEKYPKEYTGYLQLALLYAEIENKKPIQERDYTKTVENYGLALKNSPDGEETVELQPLINLINELKKNKWIN
jgi:tetratricopeptide (TPR) repeat protein